MSIIIKKGLLDKSIEVEQFIDHNPEDREEIINAVQFTIYNSHSGYQLGDIILKYDSAKELYEAMKEIFE